MPVYKIDLIFQSNGYGWKETYYRDSGTSISGGLQSYNTLADKRIQLSAFPVDLEAISVSDPLTPGRLGETFYLNPPKRPPHDPAEPIEQTGAAALTTSINVRYVNLANNKVRRIWMRGVADNAVVGGNALSGPDYAVWANKWLIYREYILNSTYGWLSKPIVGEAFCSYAYGVGETFPTFTFGAAFFDPLLIGKYVNVRFSKFNGGKSPLNREMTVLVNSATECQAAAPIAAGPMISVGKCIQYGTPEFVAATNLAIERVGRRAPGRPLLRTPGRSRAAARS